MGRTHISAPGVCGKHRVTFFEAKQVVNELLFCFDEAVQSGSFKLCLGHLSRVNGARAEPKFLEPERGSGVVIALKGARGAQRINISCPAELVPDVRACVMRVWHEQKW